jgi:hypothetical protein
MSDRMTLLERVAEAARKLSMTPWIARKRSDNDELERALSSLDAHPAAPVGETVEVRAAVLTFSDDTSEPFTAGMQWDKEENRWYLPWQPVESYVIAYISAHVELPTIPTLIARVETP